MPSGVADAPVRMRSDAPVAVPAVAPTVALSTRTRNWGLALLAVCGAAYFIVGAVRGAMDVASRTGVSQANAASPIAPAVVSAPSQGTAIAANAPSASGGANVPLPEAVAAPVPTASSAIADPPSAEAHATPTANTGSSSLTVAVAPSPAPVIGAVRPSGGAVTPQSAASVAATASAAPASSDSTAHEGASAKSASGDPIVRDVPWEDDSAKPAAPALVAFDPSAARATLTAIAASVQSCKKDDATGGGRVIVVFGPGGSAQSVTVEAPAFDDNPITDCIESSFMAAKVPPFAGNPVSVSKSFTIH